jgi:uncharacterized Zn-binding protein involved in type VI secretion
MISPKLYEILFSRGGRKINFFPCYVMGLGRRSLELAGCGVALQERSVSDHLQLAICPSVRCLRLPLSHREARAPCNSHHVSSKQAQGNRRTCRPLTLMKASQQNPVLASLITSAYAAGEVQYAIRALSPSGQVKLQGNPAATNGTVYGLPMASSTKTGQNGSTTQTSNLPYRRTSSTTSADGTTVSTTETQKVDGFPFASTTEEATTKTEDDTTTTIYECTSPFDSSASTSACTDTGAGCNYTEESNYSVTGACPAGQSYSPLTKKCGVVDAVE